MFRLGKLFDKGKEVTEQHKKALYHHCWNQWNLTAVLFICSEPSAASAKQKTIGSLESCYRELYSGIKWMQSRITDKNHAQMSMP